MAYILLSKGTKEGEWPPELIYREIKIGHIHIRTDFCIDRLQKVCFFLYYNHVSRTIHSLPAEQNINKEDKRIRSAKPYYLICGSISIAVGSSTIAMPSSQQKKKYLSQGAFRTRRQEAIHSLKSKDYCYNISKLYLIPKKKYQF